MYLKDTWKSHLQTYLLFQIRFSFKKSFKSLSLDISKCFFTSNIILQPKSEKKIKLQLNFNLFSLWRLSILLLFFFYKQTFFLFLFLETFLILNTNCKIYLFVVFEIFREPLFHIHSIFIINLFLSLHSFLCKIKTTYKILYDFLL